MWLVGSRKQQRPPQQAGSHENPPVLFSATEQLHHGEWSQPGTSEQQVSEAHFDEEQVVQFVETLLLAADLRNG